MNLFELISNQMAIKQTWEGLQREIAAEVIANEILVARCKDGRWIYRLSEMESSDFAGADSDYSNITLYTDSEKAEQQNARFLLRTAFECRFCYEGIVSLHAACVEKDGFAVAFTGESGIGKSTRARAWVEGLGAEWISGDRPAVRLEKAGATACGVPWDGKEQIFRDVERPLKAIMEVRRSPVNYVRRLSTDQARALLMRQTFVPMWDTDAALMAMLNVKKLIDQVPVYRVFSGPAEQDAREIYEILFEHPERIREEEKDMKMKDGFILRNVVDEFIVMPTGDNIAKFDGAVVLNETAAFVFGQLNKPVGRDDLLAALLNEYEIDEATAAADLDEILESFEDMGLIEK